MAHHTVPHRAIAGFAMACDPFAPDNFPAVDPVIEAAALFRRIRQFTGLSVAQLAQRLYTAPAVIEALESGTLGRLPPWPELVLVVSGFTALAGIDPRPVLTTLRDHLDAAIIDIPSNPDVAPASPLSRAVALRPAPEPVIVQAKGTAAPSMASRKRTASAAAASQAKGSQYIRQVQTAFRAGWEKGASQGRWVWKQAIAPCLSLSAQLPKQRPVLPRWTRRVALSLVITLPLALVVSWGGGTSLQAAVSVLPRPVSSALRHAEDYVLRTFATYKDGMVWIEVNDPRSRKTDKLQTHRR